MISSKVVIVTGASSGIGKGLAKRYAQGGWQLGLIARRSELLEMLKKDLESKYSIDVIVKSCDVSIKNDVYASIETIIKHFGRVDCVIANAGVSHSTPADETLIDDVETTFNINVLGAVYTAYAAIPTMIKQSFGQIVVISSLAGYRGMPQAGAYSASKSAVNAFFESMRLDLKASNVDVSIIRPGFVETPLTDRNQYYMPFLQETEQGVSKIYRAIQKKSKIFAFPWPVSWVVQSFYFWPCWLYDLVFAGMKREKKNER